jgi:serine/threonine protein kinase/tetratricopeptide (TPR) repeat protein
MMCPACRSLNSDDSRFCSQCASPLPAAEGNPAANGQSSADSSLALPIGSIFAQRYRILEELGRGGMGRVYKAHDAEIDETVSLKLIKPEITADRGTIERFQNELKLARRISHKNVCRLYHFSRSNGAYYITMEFIQGEDLKRMIRMTGQLNTASALGIAQQICTGLEEAHRMGIVHRDLKSSNIMIDREGTVHIMDFGLARSIKDRDRTGAGAMIGTPEYMSPEQVEARSVDHRSDIYSLGVIIYEMVTGRVPFKGDTPLHTAVKHKTEMPTSPSQVNALVPVEFSRIILKCLAKEADRRYQDVGDLLSDLRAIDLEAVKTEKPLSEEPSSWLGRIRSKRPRGWGIAAAVVVAAVAIRLFFFIQEKSNGSAAPSGKQVLVVLPFENLGPPENEYFADGLTEEITGRLSLLHGLSVISRTSARHYKGSTKPIPQIGQELGADYVLEGTVRWEGGETANGRVRVAAQLIRVSDDTHLWSDIYDRVLADIFEVQAGIADEVIRKLDLTVLEPERKILWDKPTTDAEAYDCYMRAAEKINRGWSLRDHQAYFDAVELLERAVTLDPDFVYAYLNLAYAHQMIYFIGLDRNEDRTAQARSALERATQLDPDLPHVKVAWAFYNYRSRRDYERALQLYREVQQALPNFRSPVVGYILRRQGRWEESLAELEEVFRLMPRNPDLPSQIAISYTYLRRFQEAEAWYQRALEIAPDYAPAMLSMAEIPLMASGDIDTTQARIDAIGIPHPSLDLLRFNLALCRRNYPQALEALALASGDAFSGFNYFLHKNLAHAMVYSAMGRDELKRFHAEAAAIAMEKVIAERPYDARICAGLGLAYAYLGRREDAVELGLRAVEIEPVSLDAANGPHHLMDLALIYTLIGEYDQAVDQLSYLMTIPAGNIVTLPLLRIDPCWDPLRSHAGFQRLLSAQIP